MQRRGQHQSIQDRPAPRLLTGAVGGFVAGVVFITLTSWFVATDGAGPLAPFTMIAGIVGAVPAQIPVLWLGMAIHAALSVVFGMIFAAFTVFVRSNAMLILAGFIYGGIIYVVDFQILARFVGQFGDFLAVNQPFEVTLHLLFGGLLALFLLRPVRRMAPQEPVQREEVPRVPTGTR